MPNHDSLLSMLSLLRHQWELFWPFAASIREGPLIGQGTIGFYRQQSIYCVAPSLALTWYIL